MPEGSITLMTNINLIDVLAPGCHLHGRQCTLRLERWAYIPLI
jgi:hypothetical protein